ncbi:MAG: endonuclease/exonuclease/phosphatase family protein [Chitinophagales bacterium]|nr:endonuclease/exonuclease/phosphatase family protein [Chitinophagales bacterium]
MNLLFAISLVLVHYSASINPLKFWPTAFLGLIYPLLLLVVVFLFIIQVFSKAKRLALLPLIALLITWSSNKANFSISGSSSKLEQISIMTWNVKNFDLYNWSGNEDTRAKILNLLEENKPDILCLQEFYTEDKGKFTNLKDIKKLLNYSHVYFAKTYSSNENSHWGLVIFSNFKILDTGKLTFVEGTRLNSCMYTDLEINSNQNIRLYNLHLQSNQFAKEDYDFIQNFGDNQDGKSVEKIISKLKKGYINRAKQSQQVLESLASSPYPSIICGDFNDTPVSFAYRTLSKNKKDAFIEKGMGFGKTYVNPSPFLRIDYLLFDTIFTVNSYKRLNEELSDHYPILVKFSI